ncbi:MAG: sulfite exporter TauE/SafE family protein [Gemmatimonadales bacterium]
MFQPLFYLQVALALFTIALLVAWIRFGRPQSDDDRGFPTATHIGLGFVINFFDTLGIGSFAPTTAMYRLLKLVPDERIPGTMNVGHTLATILQAFIYTKLIEVEFRTLVTMIIASVLGAWLGAGIVAHWPRRKIQIGMGSALLVAAVLFTLTNLGIVAGGGEATALTGPKLAVAAVGNFGLGALMTLGIGLYGPSLIMISMLGMNPRVAFPIMMGSCAFLMVVAGIRFLKAGAYRQRPALGLTIGGIPAVLVAAFIVKSLSLTTMRWLVVVVVLYTAVTMLRSAVKRA